MVPMCLRQCRIEEKCAREGFEVHGQEKREKTERKQVGRGRNKLTEFGVDDTRR